MNPLSLCLSLVAMSKICQALFIQMFVHACLGNVFVMLFISEMLNILYVVLGMQYCSVFAYGVRFVKLTTGSVFVCVCVCVCVVSWQTRSS